MSIEAALAALDADGAELMLRDGRLHARPAGRITAATADLVKVHAAELRRRLAHPLDFTKEQADLLTHGRWVLCERCTRFIARPARLPDGLCERHGETWARVPLPCADFAADPIREESGKREARR